MLSGLIDNHTVVNLVIGAFGTAAATFCAGKMGWLKGILNTGTDKVNQYFQNRWGVAVPDSVHTWQHSAIEYACAWMERYALSKLFWRNLGWDIYNKNPARLVELKEKIEAIDPVQFVEGILPPDVKAIVNEAKQEGVKAVVAAKVKAYAPGATLDQQIAATATAAKVNFPVDGDVKISEPHATKETVLKTFDLLIKQSEARQEALK